MLVEIPDETRAKDKLVIDRDAQRFRAIRPGVPKHEFASSPIVSKLLLELDPPTLDNNLAACQRIQTQIEKATGLGLMQAGLKVIRQMAEILRESNFTVTAMIGRRGGVAEIMDIEAGDTSTRNFLAIVDVGTSTIVLHLVDAVELRTMGAEACFNSQATYGREVTARMIAAEKRGPEVLQQLLV